jgi:hypothetical protein
MSSSVNDDDRQNMRSPPWVNEERPDDGTHRLVEEINRESERIRRRSGDLRSQRAEPEQWDVDESQDQELTEARLTAERVHLSERNRGVWLPTLEPVVMPPPPQERTALPSLGMVVKLGSAVAVAACAAFALLNAVQIPSMGIAASVESGEGKGRAFPTPGFGDLTQIARAEAKVPSVEESPQQPVVSLLATTQPNEVAATKPLAGFSQTSLRDVAPRPDTVTPPAAARPEPRATPAMTHAEVVTLLKRGRDLIAVGDIASARLILTRLAEAGDAEASLALAGTFDAAVLANQHVVGVQPDPAKARTWYARAAEQGSPEAKRRLQQSADR